MQDSESPAEHRAERDAEQEQEHTDHFVGRRACSIVLKRRAKRGSTQGASGGLVFFAGTGAGRGAAVLPDNAEADHMSELVSDLLDAGRIDAGTLSVDLEPAEVAALVGTGVPRRTCRLAVRGGGALHSHPGWCRICSGTLVSPHRHENPRTPQSPGSTTARSCQAAHPTPGAAVGSRAPALKVLDHGRHLACVPRRPVVAPGQA